jgi:hypothetical protein
MKLKHGFLSGRTGIGQRVPGPKTRIVYQDGQVGRSGERLCQKAHVGIDREVGWEDIHGHWVALFEVMLLSLQPVAVAGHKEKIMAPGREALAKHLADAGGCPGYYGQWSGVLG